MESHGRRGRGGSAHLATSMGKQAKIHHKKLIGLKGGRLVGRDPPRSNPSPTARQAQHTSARPP